MLLRPGKHREGGCGAGWPIPTAAIPQMTGEGVEALPVCGKEAWGDYDTCRDTTG